VQKWTALWNCVDRRAETVPHPITKNAVGKRQFRCRLSEGGTRQKTFCFLSKQTMRAADRVGEAAATIHQEVPINES